MFTLNHGGTAKVIVCENNSRFLTKSTMTEQFKSNQDVYFPQSARGEQS